ncbi:MAG: stage II sporulation protein M [Lactobacillaceae bacterium]|jgi:uncharacterized membrane protein SpoIIM required for sporulation|nr:stage II sporulation protein M [Lactobacillaceae bacterium]
MLISLILSLFSIFYLKHSQGMIDQNRQETVWQLFTHNLLSELIIILGVFTLGISSAIQILINFFLIFFPSITIAKDKSLLEAFYIFPHGIFELLSLYISTSIVVSLVTQIILLISNKKSKIKFSVAYIIYQILWIILLLFIAAVIEKQVSFKF